MYPVTQDFNDKMKATERRVYGKVQIDYTDPFLDQSIQCTANEQANISYPAQTADAVTEPFAKYAALDGSWVLGQDWALAPSPEEASTKQMGWWGSQLAGADGSFTVPYPTLTVTHFARPIYSLKVVGDSKRDEWPVDFRIDLYGPDNTLLYTEQVTGNTSVEWRKTLASPVLDVTKQVLTITKWSHPGRQVKILEFFTSIQETYEGDDILLIHLLEEREVSQGSLPVGNISANEIDIRLNNESRKFDAGNTRSPLYQLLKQNRRIKAWLGLKGDGDGMNVKQTVDFSQGILNNLVVVNNKLQLPSVAAPQFTRNSIAYKNDGTLVNTNLPRYETGKSGKAIMVEEGTTNLFTNPGWLDGTLTGWENYSNGSATGIRTVESDSKYGYRLKLERTGGQPSDRFGIFQNKTWSASGSSLTISVYFKVVSTEEGAQLRIYTDLRNPSDTPYYGRGALVDLKTFQVTPEFGGKASVQALEDGWYYFTYTSSETDNSKGSIYFWIEGGNAQIYLAWSQLEAKPYATTFVDGTREAETLTIPTAGVLNPQEGTVECWFYNCPSARVGDVYRTVFAIERGSTGIFGLYFAHFRLNPYWRFVVTNDAGTITLDRTIPESSVPDGWVYLVARWSSGAVDVFVNGTKLISATGIQFPSSFGGFSVGGGLYGLAQLNSLIDDLRISNRARTDAEIAQAYASGQALPIDEWTTYKLNFDGNLNFGQGGYYISPEYDLSAVGTAATSAISWQEDADGIQRTVYAKLDNQTDWTQVQNGGKLPISTGELLAGRKLQLKTKLLKVV